jgi:N-succinyldiaminopimelate aminotransferase
MRAAVRSTRVAASALQRRFAPRSITESDMHPRLASLQPYPFERLARLHQGVTPPTSRSPISLSIGEPKHAAPKLVLDALVSGLGDIGTYPASGGLPAFRASVAHWLDRRYGLNGAVDPAHMVLPVNGTREALFAFAQCLLDPSEAAIVAMPNPFYQIYEGAALLAGGTPYFLDTRAKTAFLPDIESVPTKTWERCRLLYLCSPGNPTGAVADDAYLERVLRLSDQYGFVIAADECYADIYADERYPPPGLLGTCVRLKRNFDRVVVFHSLSKRSSVPGLRSGFVAGDPHLLEAFRLYRTYHGCALPVHVQKASITAWDDDDHAVANRALYREKFEAVLPILTPVLDVETPAASFYLWPDVAGDDEVFARDLYAQENVIVLPGSYLGRDAGAGNPGAGRVRISLVAPLQDCIEAAHRIRRFIESRTS